MCCHGDGIQSERLLTLRLCRGSDGPENVAKLHLALRASGLVTSYISRHISNPGPRGMFLSSMIEVSQLADMYGANVRPNALCYSSSRQSKKGPSKRPKITSRGSATHAAADCEDAGIVPT